MADARPAVLITRPAPGDAATAAAVSALGWAPVLAPSLLLCALPGAAPPAAQALLLTSAAAVRALAGVAWGKPVLAVGEATATAARSAGFAHVEAAGGDAAALEDLVAARLAPGAGPLWLAVGRGYGQEVAAALRGRGYRVQRRVVYAAEPAASLPETARKALADGRVRAALFTSPRGARSMVALLRALGLLGAARHIVAVAISPRVAEVLRQSEVAWQGVPVATLPTEAALLNALGPAPDAGMEWTPG
jgi:uroporphyrinogen-III synthase